MLDDVLDDLSQIAAFTDELGKLSPKHDDKLQALIRMLKKDPVLKSHKCLIFTEFADTARYLKSELVKAGIAGVESIDGSSDLDRADVIERFSPYYNDFSSPKLLAAKKEEIRILVSTDVLSEGLNLQDATRLINYDIHWNPVRLMQRIGRVDRRMNPDFERALLEDHPDQKAIRGTVKYWNFLPPGDLNKLLTLYTRVTHKVLRISETFGIEGGRLWTRTTTSRHSSSSTKCTRANRPASKRCGSSTGGFSRPTPLSKPSWQGFQGKCSAGRTTPSKGRAPSSSASLCPFSRQYRSPERRPRGRPMAVTFSGTCSIWTGVRSSRGLKPSTTS